MSKNNKKKKRKKKNKSKSTLSSSSLSQVSSSPKLNMELKTASEKEKMIDMSESHSYLVEDDPTYKEDENVSKTKGSPSRWIMGLIALFFCFQMYAPIRYYLGGYPWDERFSWRMFSTVRTLKCQPQLWTQSKEDDRKYPLRLSKEMHMVWINLMKRGRLRVIKEFARSYCIQHPQTALYISLSCPHPIPPHQPIPLLSPQTDLCTSSETLNSLTDVKLSQFD